MNICFRFDLKLKIDRIFIRRDFNIPISGYNTFLTIINEEFYTKQNFDDIKSKLLEINGVTEYNVKVQIN